MSASRENFGSETLEKTRFSLYCQTLERLISKTISQHIHFCERAVWCFVKQLGRNQFHIGSCYGQVAESGKLEKK